MTTHEIRYGNAIIKVHRPELTAEEQKRRDNAIITALQNFGKAMYKEDKKCLKQ